MRAVIFDLDGTLVDSKRDIATSINHVRRELYGLKPLSEETITEAINRFEKELPYVLYGVTHYEPEARELFEAHYRHQCLQNARLFPGILEALTALRSAGFSLFVATNAPTESSRRILAHHGIEKLFDGVVGADAVRRPKPHPEMLHKILREGAVSQACMVGDSARDMAAASAAGIAALFVRWGYTPYESLDTAPKAVAVPADLPKAILKALQSHS